MAKGTGCSPLEGILRATSYSLRKFKSLLAYCPKVEIRTTQGGLPAIVKSKQLGARLSALAVEIASFPVSFKVVDKLKVAQAMDFEDPVESGGEGVKLLK